MLAVGQRTLLVARPPVAIGLPVEARAFVAVQHRPAVAHNDDASGFSSFHRAVRLLHDCVHRAPEPVMPPRGGRPAACLEHSAGNPKPLLTIYCNRPEFPAESTAGAALGLGGPGAAGGSLAAGSERAEQVRHHSACASSDA